MSRINIENVKGKKILVVGMARSGMASTRVLHRLGADVSVQDSKKREEIDSDFLAFLDNNGIECFFGETPDHMGIFDMAVISPGVPPELEFIDRGRKAGTEIVGELEIAYRVSSGRFIGITGTNGKTTTTTLVGEMFRNFGRKTCVVGNIGVAAINDAVDSDEDTWLVTEISSFQLQTIKYFKCGVAAILNITEDHLNRHKTMENYAATKARIFENQDESCYAVVNYDDKFCYSYAGGCKSKVVPFSRLEELDFGAFIKDGKIVIKDEDGKLIEFCGTDELIIPGSHNVENALAAAAIAYFSGIDPETITHTLKTFKGVEHRIEPAGEINGVKFVNDSKGTNPDASMKALEAIKGGIILIAGGYDKNSEFEGLINAFNGKVKKMVLLGATAGKIKETGERLGFTDSVIAADMEECVKTAFEAAEPGDTVLLSPACASWDMYDNFEIRGDHFKECVARLTK